MVMVATNWIMLGTSWINLCSCAFIGKVARLTPLFIKDAPTEIGNYRSPSLLSVPSKILESCVADIIVKLVFSDNEALVTDNQWAYRNHLTETCRQAIDNKSVVGAVFIDFQKAFHCVSHPGLLHKLEHNFGITGNFLTWLRNNLSEREQYFLIHRVPFENTKVALGVP